MHCLCIHSLGIFESVFSLLAHCWYGVLFRGSIHASLFLLRRQLSLSL